MPSFLRFALATVVLLLSLPATSQPVFDPADIIGTQGAVSGDDDCGQDPGAACSGHWGRISAESDRPDEMLSTLEFGFSGGTACSVSAPPPAALSIRNPRRSWNECPNGRPNRTERLTTTDLPGPDYGLNALRICTGTDGTLQGVEARFFKLPYLSRSARGQDVATRTFERPRCHAWQAWSVCSSGRSAAGIDIYSKSQNDGIVEGLQLVCKRVLSGLTAR